MATMTSKHHILFTLLGLCLLIACSDSLVEENPPQTELSTYQVIQKEIFDKNCTTCHQSGTTFARQSDLILTEDVSYEQLVNRSPNNSAAKADGLLLVGTEGLQSIYTSYLWEKINTPDYAHFYDDHPEYGGLMPLGGQSLTNGELRFISEWIIAGAPETGQVVDVVLLEDSDRFEIPSSDFSRLPTPASGIQLNIGPFDIPVQNEREFYYYEPLNNQEELFINKVEITMREGSHHFILYDFPFGGTPTERIYRDLYDEAGNFNFGTAASLLSNRFVFGTQWRDLEYNFPPGVALRVPRNAGFDLNSHYVNRSDEIREGEVSINLHTIPESSVQYVAENLFESYENFSLPPREITTVERTSIFDERMKVFQLTSHAHQHMLTFEIYIKGGSRDGELIYFANDWEHPPLITFDPPIAIDPGQGFTAKATYDNDTDRTLKFGVLSEDEMMIIFGAFYKD